MLEHKQLRDLAIRYVWGVDASTLPYWRRTLVVTLRITYAAGRDLFAGQLTLQAMSLVYTTLLSLVPLIAVSFSVLKGFGVHNQVEPFLLGVLEPLGERKLEIASRIIGFVDNVRVGVLGGLGLGLLVYTVISLIQKIEQAFNYAWRVHSPRPFAERFSKYLSVIVIGPLLVFSALGTTASVMSMAFIQRMRDIEAVGLVVDTGTKMLPYVLIIAAFAFVYVFVPNTRVRLRSALVGALVAGVLWQTVGWGFASFVVASTNFTAIYSGFAILVVFMIWLYLAWVILLIGASIAFYHQHPEHLASRRRELQLSARLKERLAMVAAYYIGRGYLEQGTLLSAEELARKAGVPQESMESILGALLRGGVLTLTRDEPPRYVPARSLESISLKSLLDIVRSAEETGSLSAVDLPAQRPVDEFLDTVDAALAEALGRRTLRDLARSHEPTLRSVDPGQEDTEAPSGAGRAGA